jgi:hypothetical protein
VPEAENEKGSTMAPNDTHEKQPPVEAALEMSPREKSERAAFTRMMYSLTDLQLALSAITFLSECEWGKPISKVELRRYKCYETTALIAYTRPFAKSRGGLHLTFRMFDFSPTESQLAIHHEVMTLRNKLIAHSDFDMMRVVSQHFKIPMREGEEEFVMFQTVFDEGITFHAEKCDALEELILLISTES